MHSDNCKTLLFVFVVPAPQLRDNVLTVDSAVGPKFHHDNPALQVADRERFSIKPGPTGNIRSRFPSRQCNQEKKPIDKAMAQNVSGFSYQPFHIPWPFPHLDDQSTAMGANTRRII